MDQRVRHLRVFFAFFRTHTAHTNLQSLLVGNTLSDAPLNQYGRFISRLLSFAPRSEIHRLRNDVRIDRGLRADPSLLLGFATDTAHRIRVTDGDLRVWVNIRLGVSEDLSGAANDLQPTLCLLRRDDGDERGAGELLS